MSRQRIKIDYVPCATGYAARIPSGKVVGFLIRRQDGTGWLVKVYGCHPFPVDDLVSARDQLERVYDEVFGGKKS